MWFQDAVIYQHYFQYIVSLSYYCALDVFLRFPHLYQCMCLRICTKILTGAAINIVISMIEVCAVTIVDSFAS